MHTHICFAMSRIGQRENALLQHREKHVVCLWPRAGKFVVDQRVSVFAGGGEPAVNPLWTANFFSLSNRTNEVVDHLRRMDPFLTAYQVRGAEFLVTKYENHRTTTLPGYVHGQRSFSSAGQALQMTRETCLQVTQGAMTNPFDDRREHEIASRFQP